MSDEQQPQSGLDEKLQKLKSTTVNPLIIDHLNRRLELGVVEGNCTYFIRRKQRYCTRRAVAGSVNGTCSEHSEEGLAESRNQNEVSRKRHEDRVRMEAEKAAGQEVLCEPVAKRKRVSAPKRMANPFSTDLTPKIDPHMDWSKIYRDPAQPLHIDIGCAKGRCVERLSQKPQRKGWNQLGLEIRDSLVQYSLERLTEDDKSRGNLHFMTNNFAVTADELLSTLPPKCTRLVSIQFPDPWRRTKHAKRLIVQPRLVQVLAKHTSEGAAVYISSDCEHVAEWMRKILSESEYFGIVMTEEEVFTTSSATAGISPYGFIRAPNLSADASSTMDPLGLIRVNPLDEPSERELVCEREWKRVWRCIFVRNSKPFDVDSILPVDTEVNCDEDDEESGDEADEDQ